MAKQHSSTGYRLLGLKAVSWIIFLAARTRSSFDLAEFGEYMNRDSIKVQSCVGFPCEELAVVGRCQLDFLTANQLSRGNNYHLFAEAKRQSSEQTIVTRVSSKPPSIHHLIIICFNENRCDLFVNEKINLKIQKIQKDSTGCGFVARTYDMQT